MEIVIGETPMRLPVSAVRLLLIAAVLPGENLAASAQSANSYRTHHCG
jgi:hypothetical protein